MTSILEHTISSYTISGKQNVLFYGSCLLYMLPAKDSQINFFLHESILVMHRHSHDVKRVYNIVRHTKNPHTQLHVTLKQVQQAFFVATVELIIN